jgi:lipopolysaccharide/colanic/teichoic acid biosynthesis glycosyltransferase
MISTLFKKDEAVFELIAQCMEAGIDVRVVPEFSELYGSRLIVDRVGLIPLLHLQPLKTPYARAASKRFFDLTLSLLFLPLLLTVTACLWLFKGVSSREPVLVKDLRCGKGSKGFYLYYFNPKLLRSGSGSTGQLAMLLRALPQLVNVLKGDMAIVGPRAAKAEFVAHLSSWEKRVLAIRPGLIGYGGINDPCIEDFNSERLPWELSYIEHQSLALDLSHIAGVWTSIVAGLLHIKGNWGAV